MKTLRLIVAGGLLGWSIAASAVAQNVATQESRSPLAPRPVAITYDDYMNNAPQDGAVQADQRRRRTEQAGEAKANEAKTSDNGEKSDEEAKPAEPHRLIGKLGCTGINAYGWLDMGGTINGDNPPSRYNGTLAPNDRNEFQFNQLYMVMEKTLETKERGWDIGGRVDLFYGTDYIFCESLGFETNPDGTPKWNAGIDYGLAMPQIYTEVGVGDKLSMKVGRFYTIIGYESMMATSNFFYSMNYAVRYSEPTTHTGGLLTWKQSDEFTFFMGGVNGGDQTDGLVDSLAALSGVCLYPEVTRNTPSTSPS